jgi:autotransporter passenger strand-loop-strand repeat protein
MTLFLTMQGFAYVDYYNGGYENADSLASLVTTGANSIETASEYGIDPQNDTVYADANYTDSLTAIGATIKEAVADGLAVMVRPLIDFLNPSYMTGTPYSVGAWRTYFNPGAAGSAGANSFFASYETMLLQYAQVGVANGATSLCIGTELDQLTGPAYESYWDNIISTLRADYPTLKLTYAADWDDDLSPWRWGGSGLAAGTGNLATQVSFASELDYLGIDNYAPISDAANPTLAQLIAGWTQTPTDATSLAVTGGQSLIAYFESVAAAVGKPLIFTELGYESATDAASSPSGTSTNVYDPALQSLLYQAFFEAWQQSGDASLTGVYFWNWDPNASEVGPGNGPNFSPQGEVAQTEVTSAFSTSDKLDLTQVFGPKSTLEIDITTAGSVVTVFHNVSGGETVVDIPGAEISASQILTGETDTPYVLRLSAGVALDEVTVSSGGVLDVLASGTTTGTAVGYRGHEIISSGGAASATTVLSGGTEHVLASGTASGTSVSSGGHQLIASGGVAEATMVLSGGQDYIYSGGRTVGALISSGGGEIILLGGVADATTVLSGGREHIYSGGETVGATVSSGGTETISSGGEAFALSLLSGGLTVDNGEVVISGAATLAGTLAGSGAVVETGGGDLLLSGSGAAFHGGAVISGGTIELGTAHALGTGYVQFVEPATGSAVLQIDAADAPAAGGTFANVISNFNGANEDIDLRSIAFVSGASATLTGTTLVLSDGGKTYKLELAGSTAGAYPVLSDGQGGTLIDPRAVAPRAVDPKVLAFAHTLAAFAALDAANAALVSGASPAGLTPFLHAAASAGAGSPTLAPAP